MAKYKVVTNQFPSDTPISSSFCKCHKLRKSSGKLLYRISQCTNTNDYMLEIEDISPTKHVATENDGSELVNLSNILSNLVVDKTFGSVAKLLPAFSNNHEAVFIVAVLLDLKIVRIA